MSSIILPPSQLLYHIGLVIFSAHVSMCMYNPAYIFLLCQILFLVDTAESNSGLDSVVLWLSRGGVTPEGRLLPKVVFHRRSSSTEYHLSPMVVFHQRSSSIEGCLPRKVIFHQWSSCTCCLRRAHPPQWPHWQCLIVFESQISFQ